jgi:hypothetical protein
VSALELALNVERGRVLDLSKKTKGSTSQFFDPALAITGKLGASGCGALRTALPKRQSIGCPPVSRRRAI